MLCFSQGTPEMCVCVCVYTRMYEYDFLKLDDKKILKMRKKLGLS